jgi:membrane-associated protease RseP (regulator of RpoE activity)
VAASRWDPGRAPLLPREDVLDDPRLSLVTLVATCCSVVVVRSLPFALVLLGALAIHEAAHRVVARRHGARVGWPVFLPAPVFVGTLGALLPVRTWPRSPSALLEVGAAGPLAGFAIAVTVLSVRVGSAPSGGEVLAPPAVWRLLSLLVNGEVVPLTTSDPWAHGAWAACLLTGMNLLPLGQLDGGHVAGAALGQRARPLAAFVIATVGLLGWWWHWWWPWLGVLWLLGGWRPAPVDRGPLTLRAKVVGAVTLLVGVGCFLPVPR